MAMNKQMLLSIAAIALFTSCVDKDYDLDNVDTTVKVEVKDLVVPMNLDPIYLETILDLENHKRITEINGEFAVVEKGSFTSNSVMGVDPIKMNTPTVTFNTKTLDVKYPALESLPTDVVPTKDKYTIQELKDKGYLKDDDILMSFVIPASTNGEMSIKAENIDESVTSIKELKFEPVTATINLEIPSIKQLVKNFNIEDLYVELPRGLETNDAHFKDGKLYYPTFEVNDGKVKLPLEMEGINFDESAKDGATFEDHTFTYVKKCDVEGKVNLKVKDFAANTLISKVIVEQTYNCDIKFDKQIVINEFSGGINYQLDEIKVNDMDLSGIPEVLCQTGTKVILDDPQIYLSVNNPIVAKYPECNVNPNVNFTLEPNPAADETFKSGFNIPEADNKLCLAPRSHTKYYDSNDACKYVPFESLSRILISKVDGEPQLPSSLGITVNAGVTQEVSKLKLDSNYGKVTGDYIFYAPLQLTDQSIVKYSTVEDGWNDDNLQNLTIDKMKVSFTLTDDVPFDVQFDIYPLDKEGNIIKGVSFSPATAPANAKNHAVETVLSGVIQHLDGVRIDAVGKAASNQVLKPGMNFKVENLRVTVNGNYEKEL